MTKKFYVYKVFLKGEVIYVGKGQGDRCNHVLSGKSHNFKLNEYYFRHYLNEEPLPIVDKVKYFNEESAALEYESLLIRDLLPECNIRGKTSVNMKVPDNKVEKNFSKTKTCIGSCIVAGGDVLVDIPEDYEGFIDYMSNLYEDLQRYYKSNQTLRTWLNSKMNSEVWQPYSRFITKYSDEVGDLREGNGGHNKDNLSDRFSLSDRQNRNFRSWKTYFRKSKNREPSEEECIAKISKLKEKYDD